jgi:hypothetical protein
VAIRCTIGYCQVDISVWIVDCYIVSLVKMSIARFMTHGVDMLHIVLICIKLDQALHAPGVSMAMDCSETMESIAVPSRVGDEISVAGGV